ncbi:uncharacterized protein DS421_20g689590 [Arachis hypogaea]|nr:uncharacterized protein DS421_20g689590 [Arachis hypogaea]
MWSAKSARLKLNSITNPKSWNYPHNGQNLIYKAEHIISAKDQVLLLVLY